MYVRTVLTEDTKHTYRMERFGFARTYGTYVTVERLWAGQTHCYFAGITI
jgi:hypothetical protein